jgi:hypothetical protein
MDVKFRGRSEALCRRCERGSPKRRFNVRGGYRKYAQIVVRSGGSGVEITLKSRATM